jgi:4-hydroxyphenylpyruvate dioxygenase
MVPARGPLVVENPLGLDGLDFVEFCAADAAPLERLFVQFGFQKIGQHRRRPVTLYRQNQINFVINQDPGSFARKFARQHGPSICALGFRVRSAQRAFDLAVQRGARAVPADPAHSFPAVYGVGRAAIYFIDRYRAPLHFDDDFRYLQPELFPRGRGLNAIDHLTHAVPRGELRKWVDFYGRILGFVESRAYEVRGERTGLTARVMTSPCRTFGLQILEPTEPRSQIQEFLDQHHGAGIRHLALSSRDLRATVRGLRDSGLRFFSSDHDLHFTRPVIGPMFIEVVERTAVVTPPIAETVFAAIERDQILRGYL